MNILPDQFYHDRLSSVSKARKPSPIWDLFSVEAQPGMISMLAGKPNPSHVSLRPHHPRLASKENRRPRKLTLRDEELSTALQYNMTAGIPELVRWVKQLMEEVHFPAAGAEGKTAESESWRGTRSSSRALPIRRLYPCWTAMECNYAIVDSDEEGISASSLSDILSTWETNPKTRGKPFPKVLYTVPVGSNPAGVTTSFKRRLEVLRLARQYDLMIIEDDPYYFVYYGDSPKPPSLTLLSAVIGVIMGAGRVLRLDSFSKIISAGFRLGWVTGPNVLLTAIERHPSSLTQMVVLKLMKTWGKGGILMAAALERHFERVGHTAGREDKVTPSHKPKAEWVVPDASMFFWIKLHLDSPSTSPQPTLHDARSDKDKEKNSFVRTMAVPQGILVLPGVTAFADERQTECVRLSFSMLSDEEMEEGLRRLAVAVCSASSRALANTGEDNATAKAEESVSGPPPAEDSAVPVTPPHIEVVVEEPLGTPAISRSDSGQSIEMKFLSPMLSPQSPAFSTSSDSSSSTLYVANPVIMKLDIVEVVREIKEGEEEDLCVDEGIEHSVRPPVQTRDGDANNDKRFSRRLSRVASTLGFNFRLTSPPPGKVKSKGLAKEGGALLKLKASVASLRERRRTGRSMPAA
ncbi:pyridoxal phosphate-dependent transferase [Ephemerocybe angulata]|uniref:Pyridoxal phosphate-dependent transferase n=1 Tax=Ephemerocybe angulata TaxID=980116 RepID=A0A8H6I1N9_9AGAR|nr:pyridoxal phosphate-dependent transferase [Tulosesus angulatus]